MFAILVAAVLSQVDGGSPLYSSCPEVDYADGGHAAYAYPVEVRGSFLEPVEHPDGGNDYLLPYPRAQRTACRLQACEERNVEVELWRKPQFGWLLAASFVVGVVLTSFVAYEFCAHVPICGKQ